MGHANLDIPSSLLDMFNTYNVGNETLSVLKKYLKIRVIKNKTSIIQPNEICDSVHFIVSGGFVCRYYDAQITEGKTIYFYLDQLHPFMACVDSFFTGVPTSCELQAIRESKIVSLRMDQLQPLLKSDINLFKFFHSIVLRALLEEHEFRLKLIAYSSARLYEHLLTHFPLIVREVPSRYIAEFMGITPEWLAKLKSRSLK